MPGKQSVDPNSITIQVPDVLTVNTDFIKHVEGQMNFSFTHFVGSVGNIDCKIQMKEGMRRLTLEQALSHSTGGQRILFNLPSRLLRKTMAEFRSAQCAFGSNSSVALFIVPVSNNFKI